MKRFYGIPNQGSNWTDKRKATDMIHAGCLKAGCPAKNQVGLCHIMLNSRECTGLGSGTGLYPRTSYPEWWLK